MSIDRNKRGHGYVVRLRVNGKRLSRVVRTHQQAEALERQWKDEQVVRRVGLPFTAGPITYDDLADRFLAQHQVSARTIRTLTERLTYSRRAFGPQPVRELLPESISRWNASLRLAPTTRGHALRAMRQVLGAGVRWGYLAANPAGPNSVPMPTSSATEITPFESWEQVEAVAASAGVFGPLITFACATAMRPQEWQALRWIDLDFPNRRCRIARTVQDGKIAPTGKTDRSLRTVVLQRRALDALSSLPRPLDGNQLVFPSRQGGIINLSNFRKRTWRPALEGAGLDYRPLYECRHTFATLALAAGVPLEWISKQLGHADTRITLRHYARFLPAVDARALDALDAFESGQGGREMDAGRSV